MAYTIGSAFSRISQHRDLGLNSPSLGAQYTNSNQRPIQMFTNQAFIKAGTGNAAVTVKAGSGLPSSIGRGLTLAIVTGSGSLTVSSNALDITVTLASGGSHATAVAAAINSQFAGTFVAAVAGGTGSSNVATLTKTSFKSNQINP